MLERLRRREGNAFRDLQREAREHRVAVEIADVRLENVPHPQPLREHRERVVLLVDHPTAHDLLEDEDVRTLAVDRIDDRVERRDLTDVEALVDVVRHEAERDAVRLRIGRDRRRDEGDQRRRDHEGGHRYRDSATDPHGGPRRDERRERDDRRRGPYRRQVRPERVKAERGPDEQEPAERQREHDTSRGARGMERRPEHRRGAEHRTRREHEAADERDEGKVRPEQGRTDGERPGGDESAHRDPREPEHARGEPEAEHELSDLRRARLLGAQTEPGRERDLRAVGRAGLGHENERRHRRERERAAAPKTRTATRAMPVATGHERSTTASVRKAARSARSATNASGRARASGEVTSPRRDACRMASHHMPPASATTESARSVQLLRDAVRRNVARPKTAPLMPSPRRGPSAPATMTPRNDVAKTATTMMPSVWVGAP